MKGVKELVDSEDFWVQRSADNVMSATTMNIDLHEGDWLVDDYLSGGQKTLLRKHT